VPARTQEENGIWTAVQGSKSPKKKPPFDEQTVYAYLSLGRGLGKKKLPKLSRNTSKKNRHPRNTKSTGGEVRKGGEGKNAVQQKKARSEVRVTPAEKGRC